jgi:hypothetical protein
MVSVSLRNVCLDYPLYGAYDFSLDHGRIASIEAIEPPRTAPIELREKRA